MDSYENYGGGDQEMVSPPPRPLSVPKPPGPPPSKPPGPPPSRPPGPPSFGGKTPPGPPSRPVSSQQNTDAPVDNVHISPVSSSGGGDMYDTYNDNNKKDTIPMSNNPLRKMKKKPISANITRPSESKKEEDNDQPATSPKTPPGPPNRANGPPGPPGPPNRTSGVPPGPPTPVSPSTSSSNPYSDDNDDEDATAGSFVSVPIPTEKKHISTSSNNPIHEASSSPARTPSVRKQDEVQEVFEAEEEVEDTSAPEERSKENKPSTRGLIPATKTHTEIPSEMLQRLLLKGEVVTGQFDFFYQRKGLSRRVKFLLICVTMGMYAVVMFFQWLGKALRNLMCPCQACADDIYFRRGKMVVTNKGRLICWYLETQQRNQANNQTYYRVGQKTHILNVEDIAQISLAYSDKLLCLGCCCGDFKTGIDISFNAYNHLALPWSRYLSTNHPSNYLLNLSSYIKNSVAYSVYNSIVYGNKEPLVLRVTSNPEDKIYDGEYGLEPLEDLCKLNEALAKALWNRAPYYPNKPPTPNVTDPVKKNTHTFLSAKAAVDAEVATTYGTEHVHLSGVKETYPDLTNFTLVDDDGNVTIPAKWVPLGPGEEVVSAVGQFYKPSCCEILLSVATLGYYYIRHIRSKLFERSAIILTTHRVVEILLFQSRGKVPAELGSVDVIIRSYFPKQVNSGYIRSGDGYSIQSSIYSAHGQLVVSLPSTQLLFAQKMQLVATRETALNVQEIEDMLPSIAHLQGANTLGPQPDDNDEDDHNAKADSARHSHKIKYNDSKLAPIDQILLPLMPNEHLVHRFQGGSGYKPCCLLNFGLFKSYLCSFANSSPNKLTSCGWVACVRLLTCYRRPLLNTPSCILTNHTIYYISNVTAMGTAKDAQTIGSNYNGCCSSGYRIEPFILTWLPIRKLKDHDVQINVHGAKPFGPLLCCAQTAKSYKDGYTVSINSTEGISYPLTEDIQFKSWVKDARLTKLQNVLSAVQVVIGKE